MQTVKSVLLALVLVAISGSAGAHGGGLNKDGCHNNRKTGDYHCHRGGGISAPTHNFKAPGNRLTPSKAGPARSPPKTGVFANCAEARAAGAAPVRRGDPGYGPHLDRDNDGIGCEPYPGRR